MRLSPIADQLRAAGIARVQGALELAGLKGAPALLPAHFVVADGETAGANALNSPGAIQQRTSATFGVVIMLQATSAVAGQERLSDELADREAKVIDALLGWVHPDAADGKGCEYAGAQMLTITDGAVAWLVRFRTGRLIRRVK